MAYFSTTINNFDNQLEKFWALEEYINNYNKYSSDELYCENYFTERTNTGRFVVNVPFKSNVTELDDSRELALKRFYLLEKRLDETKN